MVRKILIADDEPEIADLLREFLTDEGYFVEVVYNGKDFLEKMKENSFSLYIIDLNMPFVRGEEILMKIRSEQNRVPVIVITGYTDNETVSIEEFADCVVYKPIDMKKMLNVIEKLAV